MKIAHISDVHIRNLKYHDEYRRVFEDLYSHLRTLKPDIIINTGDSAHTKTQISPEFVEMMSNHIAATSEIAPYHIILGNHDLNLMNQDRQDAITPIIQSLGLKNVKLYKKSGIYPVEGSNVNLCVFSLADTDNYPRPLQWKNLSSSINIGLFHGSVATCVTDSNWRMTNVEYDLSLFDGLDYTLMGDIHRQQFFGEGNMAYAGSLIQQNFGEDINKGFLLWDIEDKTKFKVKSYYLTGSRKFYTVSTNDDLTIPQRKIDEGSRIRISPHRQLTLKEQREVEKRVRDLYKPYDVITLSAANIGIQSAAVVGGKNVDIENIRSIHIQERLLRDFFSKRSIVQTVMDKILDMNRKYQISVEQRDDTARNVKWGIDKIAWSNFFNFGANNVIDFQKIKGLTGIFGPNASGKSNTIDIILETIFDATTKGVAKNVHIINDNKDNASAVAEITVNDERFLVERSVERIKYGQRSLTELKEWGKTSVNFSMIDEAGAAQQLVGTLRPETEKNIRQRVGDFEDFMLTSLSAQWNQLDIIANKETKRKEILYRFLDLDIFEDKRLMANEDGKAHKDRLSELEALGLDERCKDHSQAMASLSASLDSSERDINDNELQISQYDDLIVDYTSKKLPVKFIEYDEEDDAQQRDELLKKAEVLNPKHAEVLAKITDLTGKILLCKSKCVICDVDKLEADKKRFDSLQIEINTLQRKIDDENARLSAYRNDAALLTQVPCGNNYPGCKFLVNAFESKNKILKLEESITLLSTKKLVIEQEMRILSPSISLLEDKKESDIELASLSQKLDNAKLMLENFIMKISEINESYDKLDIIRAAYKESESAQKMNKQLDEDIKKTKSLKSKVTDTVNSLRKKSKEMQIRFGGLESEFTEMTKQLSEVNELREICSAHELYSEAMGKDGIALSILTQKLPLINEEINKILANAADFSVFVEYDIQDQSIKFFLQYGQYKPRPLELGSGAEKFLGSIAIRTALLNISNLPKTNMFIIDEGFGKLDPKNMESVQRMFDYLKTVFDHVIVISHLDVMKDMVDNIIEITTDDEGYAHVNVGG